MVAFLSVFCGLLTIGCYVLVKLLDSAQADARDMTNALHASIAREDALKRRLGFGAHRERPRPLHADELPENFQR